MCGFGRTEGIVSYIASSNKTVQTIIYSYPHSCSVNGSIRVHDCIEQYLPSICAGFVLQCMFIVDSVCWFSELMSS